MVTGVYFVKVKELVESVIFDDPRGPLPPFDHKLTIKPLTGDLFLFPGWLLHQVTENPCLLLAHPLRLTIF